MAAVVVIVAGLRVAGPLLRPVALALFLALVLVPPMQKLRRRGVPMVIALPLVMLIAVSVGALFAVLITESLGEIRHTLPVYVGRLGEVESQLTEVARQWGIQLPEGVLVQTMEPGRLVEMAGAALRGFAGMMSSAFVVLLLAMFMLADMAEWPTKVRAALGRQDADLSRFAGMTGDVQRYLAIKTLISLATGLSLGIWTWAMGLDLPIVWGLIAFVLNFIPSIGSIVAAIPAVALALLQLGIGPALGVAAGYIIVNTILGTILEPGLLGRGLSISALSVLLSLFFWGWVWGPVGMLLSLPLTLLLKAALEHSEGGRWVAVLLSPAKRPEAAEVSTGEA